MNCNKDIHDELEESGDIVCPFCDQKLEDSNEKPKEDKCCDDQDVINENGSRVCRSCGVVHGYNFVKEYVDFYNNRHRFIRKSVYCRKYHINNMLLKIQEKYDIKLSNSQKHQIDIIYDELGKIINTINRLRKRMISINYIMRKIFEMMGIPYENIPISKSKRTLASYENYWNDIILLRGDKIKSIIG